MLGFTLSKLNLLILVTAAFIIIAFFMFRLTDIVINASAQQLANAYSEKAATVITSDTLCFKSQVTLPKHISYYGGINPAKRFFYLLHVSRYPEQYTEEHLTSLIFAVSDRKNPDKLIAASSVDVNAEVILYDWNPSEIDIINSSAASITFDPQSAIMRKDSFMIIKEILFGKNYLHIIACSSAGTCEANFNRVGCMIKNSRGGKESKCIPCLE